MSEPLRLPMHSITLHLLNGEELKYESPNYPMLYGAGAVLQFVLQDKGWVVPATAIAYATIVTPS